MNRLVFRNIILKCRIVIPNIAGLEYVAHLICENVVADADDDDDNDK